MKRLEFEVAPFSFRNARDPGGCYESETLELESPTSMSTLRLGSRGSTVADLQRRLAAVGLSVGTPDGIFGSLTDAAVRSFQRAHGLGADGIVGAQTWAALLGTTPAPSAPPPPTTGSPGAPFVTIPSGVLISDNAVRVLTHILRAAGLTRATVSSGRRTSYDQARIMYELIERNGVSYAHNLYGSYGDQVIDAYAAAKAAGRSATDIKSAMETRISQLGCQNVSHHCSDSYDVFDVAPSTISDSAAFRRALDAAVRSGAIRMYLSPPEDPAFHIEIALTPGSGEFEAWGEFEFEDWRDFAPQQVGRFGATFGRQGSTELLGEAEAMALVDELFPRDVIDPRIDVDAQRALIRMAGDTDSTTINDPFDVLELVKTGRLGGIYKENQRVPALLARKRGLGWWQLLPRPQFGDFRLLCDREKPEAAPIVVFRRNLDRQRLIRVLREIAGMKLALQDPMLCAKASSNQRLTSQR